jgi:Outer membrane protein beta-barrel domain
MLKNNSWKGLYIWIIVFFASASFASYLPTPAPYLGLQAGWGKVHFDGTESSDVQRPGVGIISFKDRISDSGWAGRLFAGYYFSPEWAFELGWTKFKDVVEHLSVSYSDGNAFTAAPSVKVNAIDLMIKGVYYFYNDFNIFGKLGAAYIIESGRLNAAVPGYFISVNRNVNRLYPTFAIGLGVDFACTWAADLSWTRIQKVGNSPASSTDLAALGIIYKFF